MSRELRGDRPGISVSYIDSFIGPRITKRKIHSSLLKIKPKNARVMIVPRKQLKVKGQKMGALAMSNGHFTIKVPPNAEMETIAHEFGHAALNHRAGVITWSKGVNDELAAWKWALEKWAKPNNVKQGTLAVRKRWIADAARSAQAVIGPRTTSEHVLALVKQEMPKLGLKPPLTQAESRWVLADLKNDMKDVKAHWEPEYLTKSQIERMTPKDRKVYEEEHRKEEQAAE